MTKLPSNGFGGRVIYYKGQRFHFIYKRYPLFIRCLESLVPKIPRPLIRLSSLCHAPPSAATPALPPSGDLGARRRRPQYARHAPLIRLSVPLPTLRHRPRPRYPGSTSIRPPGRSPPSFSVRHPFVCYLHTGHETSKKKKLQGM